jgi:hypothetical protein
MATLTGGAKLDAYLRSLAKRIANPKTLQVGFLEGSTYPDGTSVPMVAAIQEFGAKNIPARPFFRNAIAQNKDSWGGTLTKLLKASDLDATKALNGMGMVMKEQVQQSIIELTDPPLAPATIKRKGFAKPLIDKSVMLNSVDFNVKDGTS